MLKQSLGLKARNERDALFQDVIDRYIANGGEIHHFEEGQRGVSRIDVKDKEIVRSIEDASPDNVGQLPEDSTQDDFQSKKLPRKKKIRKGKGKSLPATKNWHDGVGDLPSGCEWILPGAIYRKKAAA